MARKKTQEVEPAEQAPADIREQLDRIAEPPTVGELSDALGALIVGAPEPVDVLGVAVSRPREDRYKIGDQYYTLTGAIGVVLDRSNPVGS